MNKVVGAEFNTYDQQQEIWRVLLSAGYKPRVVDVGAGPGVETKNWTVACISDDAREVLSEALMELQSHYNREMQYKTPGSDDFLEISERVNVVEQLRDELDAIPECL